MSAVTVVMPTYRRTELLRGAIESLLSQDFNDFTALVCDNANDDDVRALLAEFDDARLVHVPRETNLGLVRNCLAGFQAADTEFVTKLDDDDLWEPTFLSRTIGALRAAPDAALAFSDMTWIGPDGQLLPGHQARQDEAHGDDELVEGMYRPLTSMIAHGVLALNATVLRKGAVNWDAINEETQTAFDVHVLFEAARGGKGGWHCKERLVRYRVHANSDSTTGHIRQLEGGIVALQEAREASSPRDWSSLTGELRNSRITLAREFLREGEPAKARRELWQATTETVDPAILRLFVASAIPRVIAQPLMQLRGRRWRAQQGLDVNA